MDDLNVQYWYKYTGSKSSVIRYKSTYNLKSTGIVEPQAEVCHNIGNSYGELIVYFIIVYALWWLKYVTQFRKEWCSTFILVK